MKNKKGESTLIATVLIIGFTIVMALLVIVWATNFVKKFTNDGDKALIKSETVLICNTDLNFEIKNVKCSGEILIENKGDVDIEGFVLRFYNMFGNTGSPEIITGIKKYDLKKVTIEIPESVDKIEALGILNVNGNNVTCSDNIIEKRFTPC